MEPKKVCSCPERKPKRVLLLSLNWYRRKDPRTPLGVAYIYSELKRRFNEYQVAVEFIESDVRSNLSNTLHRILLIDPDFLAIGVYAWNSLQVKLMIGSLRGLGYMGKVVLGGPEITYGQEELNHEYREADYFVKGFGEIAFSDLVEMLIEGTERNISGVYRRGDEVGRSLGTPNLGLEASPFMRPELLPYISGQGFLRWQSQMGCVFRCSFCAFRSPSGAYWETDMEMVRFELEQIRQLQIREVAVLDPVFFLNKNRAIEIVEMMRSETSDVNYSIQTRFEHLNDEIISRLEGMNIRLECGLQTLDPIVQKRIRRINNKERVSAAIRSLNQHMIEFEAHLIYGLPEQSTESFLGDVTFLRNSGLKKLRIFPLSRLKGTEIDLEGDSTGLTFSPIFPREVVKTDWMSMGDIYILKEIQKGLEDGGREMTDEIFRKLNKLKGDFR